MPLPRREPIECLEYGAIGSLLESPPGIFSGSKIVIDLQFDRGRRLTDARAQGGIDCLMRQEHLQGLRHALPFHGCRPKVADKHQQRVGHGELEESAV